jgi:hypothetical protein
METPTSEHRAWRSLTRVEKQRRLARLRQVQRQQVAHDARVLLVVRAG